MINCDSCVNSKGIFCEQSQKPLKAQQTRTIIRLPAEHCIAAHKPDLIAFLASQFPNAEKEEFLFLCKRIAICIKMEHEDQDFKSLREAYAYFNPRTGDQAIARKQLDRDLTAIKTLELRFLECFFKLMELSKFKLLSDMEWSLATSSSYLLKLRVRIDKSQLDAQLLSTYYASISMKGPEFSRNQYAVFRRGIGTDQRRGYFFLSKFLVLRQSFWKFLFSLWSSDDTSSDDPCSDDKAIDLMESGEVTRSCVVERTHIPDISIKNIFQKVDIQEPTFEHVVVLYRQAGQLGIRIKQFRKVPIADMELVLPMKTVASPNAVDCLKFVFFTIFGLVAFVFISRHIIWMATVVLLASIFYCASLALSFVWKVYQYQKLFKQCYVRDKRLKRETEPLVTLLNDAFQQEVKRLILTYYTTRNGAPTKEQVGLISARILKEKLREVSILNMDHEIAQLVKLGIVFERESGELQSLPPKEANIATELHIQKLCKDVADVPNLRAS